MAADLARALTDWPGDQPLAGFLLAANMLSINSWRCKLAFFGASHFDPRSDKWVRISLFKGAPYPDDLNALSEA